LQGLKINAGVKVIMHGLIFIRNFHLLNALAVDSHEVSDLLIEKAPNKI